MAKNKNTSEIQSFPHFRRVKCILYFSSLWFAKGLKYDETHFLKIKIVKLVIGLMEINLLIIMNK